jgi:D-alanyl-D-alanine carboxypeptidase
LGEASSYAPAPSAGQSGLNWWGSREQEPKRADADPKPAPAPAAAPAPVRSAAAPASQPAPEAPRLQVAAVIPPARPRPAYVSAAAQEAEGDEDTPSTAAIPRHRAAADGSTSHAAPASASAVTPSAVAPSAVTPSAKTTMRVAMAEPPGRPKPESGVSVLPRSLPKDEDVAKAASVAKTQPPGVAVGGVAVGRPAGSGWVIQIGATEDAGKAAALLSKAKSQKGALLATAQPFTETVRKGNETLYRARFAGLEESKAEAACKALKNSGFSCFASRN